MDLFTFFEFYYYAITRNKKRFKLVNEKNSMLTILLTPVLLFLIHMTASFVVLFHTDSVLLTYTLPIWAFIVVGNLAYANMVRDEFWKDKRKQRDAEIRKERKEKEAEEMYRQWQSYTRMKEESARMKEESNRQERERRERMYKNANQNSYTVDINRMNALRLMGLNGNPNVKDIKSAYKRLAKIHHPDLGGTQTNFIKLTRAYDYLMNK